MPPRQKCNLSFNPSKVLHLLVPVYLPIHFDSFASNACGEFTHIRGSGYLLIIMSYDIVAVIVIRRFASQVAL